VTNDHSCHNNDIIFLYHLKPPSRDECSIFTTTSTFIFFQEWICIHKSHVVTCTSWTNHNHLYVLYKISCQIDDKHYFHIVKDYFENPYYSQYHNDDDYNSSIDTSIPIDTFTEIILSSFRLITYYYHVLLREREWSKFTVTRYNFLWSWSYRAIAMVPLREVIRGEQLYIVIRYIIVFACM